MTFQGHPKSLILAPIESAYVTIGRQNSNLGPILPRFRAERQFLHTTPLLLPKFRVFLLSTSQIRDFGVFRE